MSEHRLLATLAVNASARSVQVDWPSFLESASEHDHLNPIDEFYTVHRSLNRLAGVAMSGGLLNDLVPLMTGQLVLGYVSASEQYLRRLLAVSVSLCPRVRERVSGQQIPFGALDYYASRDMGHALTERTSFSEPGKVASFLTEKFAVRVGQASSLQVAIQEFERLCQLRHALVHSRGLVNSTNMQGFSSLKSGGQRRVRLEADQLQSVAGICIDLVRETNAAVARSVLWCWLLTGLLSGNRRSSRKRLEAFAAAYFSDIDRADGLSPKLELETLLETCDTVAIDLSGKS